VAPPAREITVTALAELIATPRAPQILDVRSAAEHGSGHIPGAAHMPFWLLPFRVDSLALKRDAPVVVYCGHGPRAQMARLVLERAGYQQVVLLSGHMQAWRDAGLPESKSTREPSP
jgi:rhodanese-related sulfurtransferase